MTAVLSKAFVIFRGQNGDNDDASYFIDSVNLNEDITKSEARVNFISNVPDWFRGACAVHYDSKNHLYVCSPTMFGRLELETVSWDKLPPPIGDLGDSRVWLCGVPGRIYLLTGKPQSGSPSLTNTIQVKLFHNIVFCSFIEKYPMTKNALNKRSLISELKLSINFTIANLNVNC